MQVADQADALFFGDMNPLWHILRPICLDWASWTQCKRESVEFKQSFAASGAILARLASIVARLVA